MIVDDHDLVREGLRAIIKDFPDWTLCAEAVDAESALKLGCETKPDVVIVDVSMPRTSGLDVVVQLKKLLPQTEFLVLTMHDSERIAAQALRSGAKGYVLKSDGADKLIDAISALSRHQPFFSPAVSEGLLKSYLQPDRADGDEQLTSRERQVVKLVAEGNSNKKIANLLNLSVKTVETHRSALMRKIGAKSSAEIALYAVRNELVQL
jgi:DNA-binding NarL/FixJ family response regulator